MAAAAEEARLMQEAIACEEAEVKALEEALAQKKMSLNYALGLLMHSCRFCS